jgi:hypothetical protein
MEIHTCVFVGSMGVAGNNSVVAKFPDFQFQTLS